MQPNGSTWRHFFAQLRHRFLVALHLPSRAFLWLCEAFVMLGLARGAVLVLPFKRIAPHLGPSQRETASQATVREQEITSQIAWAIHVASRYTPWDSNCLAQAIAGKLMLRNRGVASTLYIGSKHPASGFEAHAWLRSGSHIVTGGPVHVHFKIISTFGAPSSK